MGKRRREFQFQVHFDDEVNKGLSFEVADEATARDLVTEVTSKPWRGRKLTIDGREVTGVQPFSVTLAEAFEVETASEIVLPRAEGVSDAEIIKRLTPSVDGTSVYILSARFIDAAGVTLHRYLYGSIDDALEASALIAGRGSAPIEDPVPGTNRFRRRAVSSLVIEMETRRSIAMGLAATPPNLGGLEK